METVGELYKAWLEKFRSASIKFRSDGIPGPEETAQRIIAHALGKKTVSGYLRFTAAPLTMRTGRIHILIYWYWV